MISRPRPWIDSRSSRIPPEVRAARIESVVVLFDYGRQAKRAVSPELRATLLRYATDDVVDAGD